MFEIDIERNFSAAHYLNGYKGNCSALHGHNWVVQVFVQAEELDDIGIAMDFRKLKNELDSLLDELDHCNLNELEFFKINNPTSEQLAKFIFDNLAAKLDDQGVFVKKVRVCESPGSGATYYKG
jgi:6-pyruvoyltetrahydropterin/6-carboxytetrahydropterin synthase